MKKILIRDLTLRDGQQSLFATRVKQEQIDKVLPLFKEANFYAMEVWGGAVPDSVMRFLNENPWDRLEKIKAGIGKTSKLTALSRGRNLFGYNPYPDEVIKGFNENSVKSGVDIMRIFDCLNDVNNMKSTIKYIKKSGGIADCAVCYTIDPKFTSAQKMKYLFKGKKIPKDIFTIDYFVQKAKLMEELGAGIITIKDMAGLIPPSMAGEMVRSMKKNLKIPIDYHTHCTPGYGLASALMAMINGADIIDTNIYYFSGGSAAPAIELVQIFAKKLGIDTGLNMKAISKINKELKIIRQGLSDFDPYKEMPIDFDFIKDKLPKNIDQLFDKAIDLAKKDVNEEELLNTIHQIEDYFNFPKPNEKVKDAEIPGGMYTNMLAQLKQLKLEELFDRVLKTVPMVRIDAGCPPLVTPSSQIIGAQSVNCVIDQNNKKPFYTKTTVQFINLVKGCYGKTPLPVDPKFRKKIAGVDQEMDYDTSNYKKQDNPTLAEFDNVKLAKDYKEELLLELFPAVATTFLKKQIEKHYNDVVLADKKAKDDKHRKAKAEFDNLSPEKKEKLLEKGLYNYDWGNEK